MSEDETRIPSGYGLESTREEIMADLEMSEWQPVRIHGNAHPGYDSGLPESHKRERLLKGRIVFVRPTGHFKNCGWHGEVRELEVHPEDVANAGAPAEENKIAECQIQAD